MGTYALFLIPDSKNETILNKLRRKTIQLSKAKKKRIPLHISVRETFNSDKIEQLIKRLNFIAKGIKPISVKLEGYSIFGSKYVVLDAVKTKQIQNLHEKVLAVVDEFRTGFVKAKYKKSMFGKKQNKYLKEHGYPFCFELYCPHMTLAYNIDAGKIAEVKKFLDKQKLNYKLKIDALTVVKKQKSWRTIKLIKFRQNNRS